MAPFGPGVTWGSENRARSSFWFAKYGTTTAPPCGQGALKYAPVAPRVPWDTPDPRHRRGAWGAWLNFGVTGLPVPLRRGPCCLLLWCAAPGCGDRKAMPLGQSHVKRMALPWSLVALLPGRRGGDRRPGGTRAGRRRGVAQARCTRGKAIPIPMPGGMGAGGGTPGSPFPFDEFCSPMPIVEHNIRTLLPC